MKKTEIATRVFDVMDAMPLTPLGGAPLLLPLEALAGLSLVPWFCDLSIHWALRLTVPGDPLKKALLPKLAGTYVAPSQSGALLVGVPGDGIAPSTHALFPLAAAVAAAAQPGMTVELATANLGVVKRDVDAKADTHTAFGNHLYRGTVDASGRWRISDSVPALSAEVLSTAIACGSLVPNHGPWTAKDPDEAYAICMQWFLSREANINPAAVKHFVTLRDLTFQTADQGMIRRFYGLALAFFRVRLAGGPFHWPEPTPYSHPLADLQDASRTVVG
jgi:hypothetical protein